MTYLPSEADATALGFDVAGGPQSQRRSGPVRGPIILLVCLVGMVILLLLGTLLFGASSHASPSGSVDGAVQAATENYRIAGVNVDELSFNAEKSLVDPHWAIFTAVPVVARGPQASYGYELFTQHRWVVVEDGQANVGCAAAGAAPRVPLSIIESFGRSCPG